MIDNILKIEKLAKLALRIGLAIYFLYFGSMNLWSALSTTQTNSGWGILIFIISLITAVLLLTHFKAPKLAALGGAIAAVSFLVIVVVLAIIEIQQQAMPQMIILRVLKDLILAIASIILLGESLKEMVRERITKPFPVR
ncbi:hypothetical protein ACFOUP_09375 [Belliella kenyensis]|uniref:Uncharacterized protein n=1 Tax=Belliella kenyensis TaxID=1472724 RepID=A0ABV8EKN4_9BACT|nr:hypothetical protein [Belliella kenyensis]MCH7403181.1 hypothetical protein [Belliella kenyensis]MDN3604792.1 hypothetical protein [Belliella kenyensis]